MFGELLDYKVEANCIHLFFEQGENISTRLELITPEIVNVFAGYESKEHRSKAIEGDKKIPVAYKVWREQDKLTVETSYLKVVVTDGFYVDFYDKKGKPLCKDYRGLRTRTEVLSDKMIELVQLEGHSVDGRQEDGYPVQVMKELTGDEAFYGFGDKAGVLNKREYEYEMWNSDIPQAHTDDMRSLYKSIPFFITLKKESVYGIFLDNTYKTYFNMGKECRDYYYYGADAGNLDYYFIAGDKMTEIIEHYTYLTGRTELPQLWTLGHQQSRWGYESAKDMRRVAAKYREYEIPCDAIHFDIDYMDGYRVFTWNDKSFGTPGEVIKELGEQGFKVVTIIDPGVKVDGAYAKYQEGVEQGYFAKTPEGENYVNAVWPGEAVYPDFGNSKVRTWWADSQKYLVDLGVRGVWNDMNEPASFQGPLPLDVVFTDEDEKADYARMHNVYGHLMAKATYEGLKKYDKRRPFVITRACYSGSQKYTTAWTGDNQSLWAHLQMAIPQLCNLGLSGMPFVGTDIGGFGADTTSELMCRWIQVGCFSPLCRNHSGNGTRFQEPWQFDESTRLIYKKYVELRYEILPYIYDLFWEEAEIGMPIIRPLILHYERDENVKNCNDEFLVGEHLLVAPVVQQGAIKRMIYLPKGTWYDYWTGERKEGEQYFIREAGLDTCPIYVKAGTILPTYEVLQYVGKRPYDKLILKVYPGEGRYLHYQDNGEDYAYREGAYNLYEFTQGKAGQVETRMLHEGYEKYATIQSQANP